MKPGSNSAVGPPLGGASPRNKLLRYLSVIIPVISVLVYLTGIALVIYLPNSSYRDFYVDEHALMTQHLTTTNTTSTYELKQIKLMKGTLLQNIELVTKHSVQSYLFNDELQVVLVPALRGDGLNSLCFVMPYSNVDEEAIIVGFAKQISDANYLSKDVIVLTYQRNESRSKTDEYKLIDSWLSCYMGSNSWNCLQHSSFQRSGRISEAFIMDITQPFNYLTVHPRNIMNFLFFLLTQLFFNYFSWISWNLAKL
jgi:hypothetical protein